ncbi:MAG: type II toxin-antitoxin system VapC family toxin [Burkholderiales bacterium]|nr:type II toxin-antitoxin system VapC family toxin [Burkholderiales bacterium]
MLALDTNVLVRYLAQDDARQSALANRLIESQLTTAERGFVSLVALLETVWVMESRYGADAATVQGILTDLLETAVLEVQEGPAVRAAAALYARGGVDLHDCLIVALAAQRQAKVVSFDTRAAKRLGMQLLR